MSAPTVAALIPRTRTTAFSATPVTRAEVVAMLEAARQAPSARNSQIWHFTVFADRALIARAAETVGAPQWANAPLAIAALGKPAFFTRVHAEQPFLMIDVPIAMSHITLAAAEMGIAVEWVFPRDERPCQQALELSDDRRLVAVGFVGRAGEGTS